MPETVTVNDELGIIEIHSSGAVTFEDALESLKTISKIMTETGITRLITDTREQDFQPSPMKVYEFAKRLPADAKIALVTSDTQTTSGDVSFMDNVAQNRGINTRIFSSPENAMKWLVD